MYRGIIQHRGYITEYLRDQIMSRKLEQPIGYGRIYRVVHDSTKRDGKPSMSSASSAALVEALSHPNGWRRDTAQRLLVERDDASVVPALTKLAGSAPEPRTRLHALWTLDGMDRLEPALVLKALEDPSRDVRTSAVRLSERWIASDAAVQKAVLAHMNDKDWSVRRQLAATLGALGPEARTPAVVAMLEGHGDDPMVVDAALSGIAGSEQAVLEQMAASREESPVRSGVITMLAATIVRSKDDPAEQRLFEMTADTQRPEWQRGAMLAGAESAVLGAPLPGASRGRGRGAVASEAPCPTCPGARSGPGGAPAFPSAGRTGGQRGAGGRGAGPRGGGRGAPAIALTLTQEPALVRVASAGGELGARAAALLERIGWPGKPGMAAAAAPLSAADQARFNAGEQLYTSLCAACHQPDGRGREKLAPSLVGSELALDPPGIPARILINGKEGAIGLMPPLGAGLTDEQIADVLTYVRHAWGQTGSPVDPATVSAVRAETASRTRPWTNEELQKLAASGVQ
jgi:mono/diheme cytochrome c family protein